MNESLVAEYSRQIRIKIISSMTLLALSFIIMFIAYERFYLSSVDMRVIIIDLVHALPLILFLFAKDKFFRNNWFVKVYLLLSLGGYLIHLSFFEEENFHSMFPILYPLCVVMYLNNRKALYFSLYLASIISMVGLKILRHPEMRTMALIQLLSVLVITLFSLFIKHNMDRIGQRVTFIKYADHKTNLPNRDRFIHDLYSSQKKNIVAILNVDGFKYINDLYGHYIGDALLVSIGKTICSLFPHWDIYRLSGSEFGLILSPEKDKFMPMLENLKEIFISNSSRNLDIEGIKLHVALSLGIAVEGLEDTTRKNILVNTDIALQEAKKIRSKIYLYHKDSILKNRMNEKHHWEQMIDEAFRFDHVKSYFQPIMCNKTGTIKRYECLARLIDSEGAVHSPRVFLPHLVSTHYYSKLTRSMVSKCISTLESIPCDLSLNLSVDDLYDPFTMQYILLLLHNHHSIAHRLQFEILDTAHMGDPQRASHAFQELKEYGSRIALDDFGSGGCDFEYMTLMNVDSIKIDGSLIQKICHEESAYNMARNIVRFCKGQGVEVVAEYVSDREIYKKVLDLDVDYSQGYFIGKPQDPESLMKSIGDPDQLVRTLEA